MTPEPDARVVDDKMAEARERAERIGGAISGNAESEAVNATGRQKTTNGKSRGNGDDTIADASLSGNDRKNDA